MSPEKSVFVTGGLRCRWEKGGADCCRPHGDYPPRGASHPHCGPQAHNFPSTSPSVPPLRLTRGSKHTLCWLPRFFFFREKKPCNPSSTRVGVTREVADWPLEFNNPPRQRHTCLRTLFQPDKSCQPGLVIKYV